MRLSIITVNLNHAAGLRRTIASVLSQTWSDYEYIAIDGGSTDGSREILVEHAARLAFWCSERDGGIYAAMNKGIRHATGDYLLFLNSGDILYSDNALSSLFAHDFSEEMVFADCYVRHKGMKIKSNDMSGGNYNYFFFYNRSIPHQSTLYRRDVFTRYGMYDESLRIISDWKHAIETIYLGGATTRYLRVPLALFEGGGISSSGPALGERGKVWDELFPAAIQRDFAAVQTYIERIDRLQGSRTIRPLFHAVERLADLLLLVRGIVLK